MACSLDVYKLASGVRWMVYPSPLVIASFQWIIIQRIATLALATYMKRNNYFRILPVFDTMLCQTVTY